MRRAGLCLIVVSFVASLAVAGEPQQPPPPLDGPQRIFQDPLFDQLIGNWKMAGAVRGRAVTYAVRAEWVLNHQHLRLEMRDVADPSTYQAHVYIGYDNTSERYVAHWIDVFGARFCETLGYGQRSGNAVRFVFEYPDGPFHTTFTLDPGTKSWAVLMQDRGPDGAWREFAHYTMKQP